MLQLQEKAKTLNLVTGTHFAPSIVRAVELSGKSAIPLVWNSSGYETSETLDLIAPVVDIHLPDLKTLSPQSAGRLFRAPDYPATAAAAIRQMASSHPLEYEGDRLVRGLIMRHLVMPGSLDESVEVLRWFAEHLAGRALLSLMVQFVDTRRPGKGTSISEPEYESLLDLLDELGIEEGFIQETGDEVPWIPDFTRENPFPEAYSLPIWHGGAKAR
jgi:putative pyruvate formate lyase activating enzyme